MKHFFCYKKSPVIFFLALIVITGAVAMKPAPEGFKNLKVLPRDIDSSQLDSLMKLYSRALGVSCSFCHSKVNDTTYVPANAAVQLDFAIDNNMKDEARDMMRMTLYLNKHYFREYSSNKPQNDHLLNTVSCNTCHRGNPYPVNE